jgi:4-amino-4-deoxy-L-arabinose transferase-like glycosyltransferase
MYGRWRREHKKETLLFALAFALRVVVFLLLWQWFIVLGHMPETSSHYPTVAGDSESYFILSQNLLHNHVYSLSPAPPFIPESFRLPGYPFFLYFFQLLGFPLVLIIFIQMALGSGSVVLTYLLGKKFLPEKTAYGAALLLSIEPTTVFFSTFTGSETVCIFAMLLGIYLFFRKEAHFKKGLLLSFVGGLFLGFSILTRVIVQFLPPFLLIAYVALYWKELKPYAKSITHMAAFCAGILLVLAPWSLRDHALYGVFDISATPYVNFAQYNLPLFYAYSHNVSLSEAYAIYNAPLISSSTTPVASLANKAIFQKQIQDTLRGHLFSYLRFHLIKTLPFFVTDGVRDMNRYVGLIPIPPDQTNFSDMLSRGNIAGIVHYFISPSPNLWMLLAGSLPWILITALWLFELAYVFVKRPPEFWFVCIASGIILYFALLTGPVVEHRYRMPAAPFMLLLAVQGALTLWHIFKTKNAAPSPGRLR